MITVLLIVLACAFLVAAAGLLLWALGQREPAGQGQHARRYERPQRVTLTYDDLPSFQPGSYAKAPLDAAPALLSLDPPAPGPELPPEPLDWADTLHQINTELREDNEQLADTGHQWEIEADLGRQALAADVAAFIAAQNADVSRYLAEMGPTLALAEAA